VEEAREITPKQSRTFQISAIPGSSKKNPREPKGYRVIGLFYDNLPGIDDVVSEGKPCKFMKRP